MKKLITSLFLFLALLSCGKSEPQQNLAGTPGLTGDSQPPIESLIPKITKLRWYKTQWQEQWSKSLKERIEKSSLENTRLLSRDLRKLGCPSYNSASAIEKQKFWIVFVASIAANESAFNPKLRYYEPSLKEYSEGLLQLSLSDKSSSRSCKSLNRKSILTPIQNLSCGLSILERQVRGVPRRAIASGTLFPRKAYYWSVLTRPSSQIKVIDFFKTHLSQLEFCK